MIAFVLFALTLALFAFAAVEAYREASRTIAGVWVASAALAAFGAVYALVEAVA